MAKKLNFVAMKKLITLIMLVLSSTAFAQNVDPVKWNAQHKELGDNTFLIMLEANIQSGWYLYSQHIEGDAPIPTSFELKAEQPFNQLQTVAEKGNPIVKFDKLFEKDIRKFANKVVFETKVSTYEPIVDLNVEVNYMSCSDRECLPPTTESFELHLITKKQKGTIAANKAPKNAQNIDQKNDNSIILQKVDDMGNSHHIPFEQETEPFSGSNLVGGNAAKMLEEETKTKKTSIHNTLSPPQSMSPQQKAVDPKFKYEDELIIDNSDFEAITNNENDAPIKDLEKVLVPVDSSKEKGIIVGTGLNKVQPLKNSISQSPLTAPKTITAPSYRKVPIDAEYLVTKDGNFLKKRPQVEIDQEKAELIRKSIQEEKERQKRLATWKAEETRKRAEEFSYINNLFKPIATTKTAQTAVETTTENTTPVTKVTATTETEVAANTDKDTKEETATTEAETETVPLTDETVEQTTDGEPLADALAKVVIKKDKPKDKSGKTYSDPVKWNFAFEPVENNIYEMVFNAKIDDNWYVYAQDNEQDGKGPYPLTFQFEENDKIEFVDDLKAEGNTQSEYDVVFDKEVKRYSDNVTFKRTVKLKDNVDVKCKVKFMAGNDERYLLPQEKTFVIPASIASAGFTASENIFPLWLVLLTALGFVIIGVYTVFTRTIA